MWPLLRSWTLWWPPQSQLRHLERLSSSYQIPPGTQKESYGYRYRVYRILDWYTITACTLPYKCRWIMVTHVERKMRSDANKNCTNNNLCVCFYFVYALFSIKIIVPYIVTAMVYRTYIALHWCAECLKSILLTYVIINEFLPYASVAAGF